MARFLSALSLGCLASAYDNGLGLKPPLGWNTWCTLSDCHNGDNRFFDRCNEWEIKSVAEAMLSNGMTDLGYEYLNLDDCWAAMDRDEQGNIQPDPDRFPSGMKALADWLHERGLKFGLYTSMGDATCNPGGRPRHIPGSFGHYKEDAQTFADWGMDYVKADWCGKKLTDAEKQHTELSDALNATGRPIFFELCRGYSYSPIPDYVAKVANAWRTTGDHQDQWSNTKKVIESFFAPSNPGVPHAWNYGDFLMVGGPGCNTNTSEHCPRSSDDEYRTEFAAWSIAASPLIVATDIRNMTPVMKQCLLNKEALAINQDHLAAAGKKVADDDSCGKPHGQCPVMHRRLTDGTHAALLINLHDTTERRITLTWDMLGLDGSETLALRDVLLQKELGTFTGSFTSEPLKPHESVYLRLSPSSMVV